MQHSIYFGAIFWLGVIYTVCVAAESQTNEVWPQFLGRCESRVAVSRQIPIEFGPQKHVVWATEVAHGHSSPIVWGDHIFFTASDDTDLMVMCYSKSDGTLRWKWQAPIDFETDYFHADCSPASPTSCTDGRFVFSCFGSYGVVAHDFQGKLIWTKRLPTVAMPFGLGSSPVLYEQNLYLVSDVPGFSALFCFDAATGTEKWMTARPGQTGCYATPVIWKTGMRTELVVAGAGTLDSYDSTTGDRLWTVRNMPMIACPSPIVSEDLLVFGAWTTSHVAGKERAESVFDDDIQLTENEANNAADLIDRFDANQDQMLVPEEVPESRFKRAFRIFDFDKSGKVDQHELQSALTFKVETGRNVMVAVRPGGSGDITDTHIIWETDEKLPYVASPVIHQGFVYYVKKGGLLTRVALADGKVTSTKRLGVGGEYYATPLVVDDKLLVAAARGIIFIIDPSEEMEILTTNQVEGEIAATPAIVDNVLYVRTVRYLYAFGNKQSP